MEDGTTGYVPRMADTIMLKPLDDDGARIIDAFAQQTGLSPQDAEGGKRFDVREHHDLKVRATLDGVDQHWADHVELGDPAASEPTTAQD